MKRFPITALAAVAMVGGSTLIAGNHSYAAAPHAAHKTIKAAEGGQSYIFAPAKTTIKVGTKVTWTDPTDAPHTVSSDTASWSFNKQLTQNATVTFTFKKAGTYKYHCQFHAGMTGTIIVKK